MKSGNLIGAKSKGERGKEGRQLGLYLDMDKNIESSLAN
jgi:hypothetical protein